MPVETLLVNKNVSRWLPAALSKQMEEAGVALRGCGCAGAVADRLPKVVAVKAI